MSFYDYTFGLCIPPLDPGWKNNPDLDTGSGMNTPDHFFESLETVSRA